MSNLTALAACSKACVLLALLACGVPGGQRSALAAEEIAVHSIYLTHPVGDVRRISIEGILGGTGSARLDTNRCGQNLFGDTTICTTQPVRPIPIELKLLNVKDIKGQGRRVYRVEGALGPPGHRYYLVVPRGLTGNYRLAIVTAEGRVRVVSLEEQGAAASSPGGTDRRPTETRTLGRAAYAAVQEKGVVTLRARGTHPGRGYSAVLERADERTYPPVYRLMQIAPPQGTEQEPTPFEASVTFPAMSRVPYVHVEDAEGRHRVPVQRIGGR